MSGPQGLGNDLLELEFAKDPAEGEDVSKAVPVNVTFCA